MTVYKHNQFHSNPMGVCSGCGAESRYVVPVEPCEHGNYARHLIDEYAQDYYQTFLGRWCEGSGFGGDDA